MSEILLTNSDKNVSATKGVAGGYCWRAPVGTPLPDSPTWKPSASYSYALTADESIDSAKTYYTRSGYGTTYSPYTYAAVEEPEDSGLSAYYERSAGENPWQCMGYITDAGETFSTTSDVQEFRDQNGDVMDTSQNNYGESFSCAFAETKKSTFESIYGVDAVTDKDGVLKVNHTGAEPQAYTYAYLFLLKDGRKWVRYAEKCKRREISDLTTNSSTVLAWQATYTALRSETTDGYFVDLFESTETEA